MMRTISLVLLLCVGHALSASIENTRSRREGGTNMVCQSCGGGQDDCSQTITCDKPTDQCFVKFVKQPGNGEIKVIKGCKGAWGCTNNADIIASLNDDNCHLDMSRNIVVNDKCILCMGEGVSNSDANLPNYEVDCETDGSGDDEPEIPTPPVNLCFETL
uniref:Uncharacterized protein LOC102805953 n=1 Tax=Saccoglossus kowalevskii TaxID=10224 RepID=A0ABM0LZN3_SACKO|nr:PREDICTED: uncharacterized protein LOC102805953 [Saccoglossus kowalevskii]